MELTSWDYGGLHLHKFVFCHFSNCNMLPRIQITHIFQQSAITLERLSRIIYRLLHNRTCDQVCQSLATGQWFSPAIPVYSTNKTDCHDITEILLKMVLNTINHKRTDSTKRCCMKKYRCLKKISLHDYGWKGCHIE